MEEKMLWKGSPSQITNLASFVVCGLLNLVIVGAFIVLWQRESLGLDIAVDFDARLLFVVCLALLFFPTCYAFFKWLRLKSTRYEVTSTRVRRRQGFLSIRRDDTELYRVKDITVLEPFLLRLFSVGTLHLHTSDRSTPEIELFAVPNVNKLHEQLRTHVEKMRDRKRVREIDVE